MSSARFFLHRIFAWLGSAAVFATPVAARAFDLPEDGRAAEAARSQWTGEGAGSLAQPKSLDDADALKEVCRVLAPQPLARAESDDAFERGKQRHDRKKGAKAALWTTYSAVVGSKGFAVEDYRYEDGVLPLDLERALVGAKGALSLSVMDRRGAELALVPDAAKAAVAAKAEGALDLRVVFLLDAADEGPSPCFTYPRSEAYVLRIVPLQYELVERGKTAPLSSKKTPVMTEVMAWLQPGRATVRLAGVSSEGPLGDAALTAMLESKRETLSSCLSPVTGSASATAVVAFTADASPSGKLESVHAELASIDEAAVITCLQEAVASLSAPKSSRASKVRLLVAVDREAADAEAAPRLN